MKAFTLIEVMMAVAISGIFAAMAIPNLSGAVDQQKTLEESVRIEGFLMAARNDARVLNRCVEVTIVPAAMDAVVYDDCVGVALAYRGGVTPTLSNPSSNKAFRMEKLRASPTTIVFLPNGAVASKTALSLVFNGDKNVEFELWPATGSLYRKGE